MHKKIFALILVDQITKLIFSSRDFFPPEADPPLAGFFRIHLVKNYGLGFSLNFGLVPNLILITAALGFFIYYYYKNRLNLSWLGKIFFSLIIAGALSNVIDRVYLGHVRDFLDLGLGFTFNFADAMIVCGLVLVLFTQTKTTGDKLDI